MSGAGVCRACLAPPGEEGPHAPRLLVSPARDMFTCTTGLILQDDSYTKALCDPCHELVIKFYDFKQLCQQSHYTLQKWHKGEEISLKQLEDSFQSDGVREPSQFDDAVYHDYNGSLKVELDEHKTILKLESTGKCYNDPLFGEGEIDNFYSVNGDSLSLVIKKTHRKYKQLKFKIKSEGKSASLPTNSEYGCDECKRKFALPERLEAHKLKHKGKKTCDTCNKHFKSWSSLHRHQLSLHVPIDIEALKCQTCGKIFKTLVTLKRHKEIHDDRSVCMCHVCGRGFKSKKTLQSHLQTHTEDRQRVHGCEQCGKKFYTVGLLSTHVSRRHSGRRYICQVCSYPFVDKYSLTKHQLKHEGIKPYQCDICNNKYSTHSFLIEHRRTHTGEKPFKCSFCAKGFVSKKRLLDHTRTHTGEKPYKCGKCEQAFIQRGTLKRHMKVHEKCLLGS